MIFFPYFLSIFFIINEFNYYYYANSFVENDENFVKTISNELFIEMNESMKNEAFDENPWILSKKILFNLCTIVLFPKFTSSLPEKYVKHTQNANEFCANISSDMADAFLIRNAKLAIQNFGGKTAIFKFLNSVRHDLIKQNANFHNNMKISLNKIEVANLQRFVTKFWGNKMPNGTTSQNAIEQFVQLISADQLEPNDLITLITGPIWTALCQEIGLIDAEEHSPNDTINNEKALKSENILPKNSNSFRRRKRDRNSKIFFLILFCATAFILLAISFGLPKIISFVAIILLMWLFLWFISRM